MNDDLVVKETEFTVAEHGERARSTGKKEDQLSQVSRDNADCSTQVSDLQ